MVRLKDQQREKQNRSLSLFQFHYGTIKSRMARENRIGDAYFNSTMVRLKVFNGIILFVAIFNFNSTMVRLKVYSLP